jgi:hypothetical protein
MANLAESTLEQSVQNLPSSDNEEYFRTGLRKPQDQLHKTETENRPQGTDLGKIF